MRPASSPTLVLLAAGMGSRFGGLKQLAAVGPSGETLMDYSVHDALRAGFQSVVFVVRPDLEAEFTAFAAQRYHGVEIHIALQRLEDGREGHQVAVSRDKPWGTGQAVLAAEPMVSGPFAVVNADDFYGAEAFRTMATFLAEVEPRVVPPEFALAAYPISDTLSPSGGVNRGLLRVTADGRLQSVEEATDVRRTDSGLTGRVHGHAVTIRDDALVSMNLWGFHPPVFPILRHGFQRFLTSHVTPEGEYLLPAAIEQSIATGSARVQVLASGGTWLGMTHAADVRPVADSLERLVRDRHYPTPLFRDIRG